jgi:signal transduction histidine kinase
MHFTTKKHGSGIGLYVARAVVTAEEGQISLDSSPGDGTRVCIRLPRPLAAKQAGA